MDEAVVIPGGVVLSRRKMMIGLALAGTVTLSELYVPRRSAVEISDKTFDALFPEKLGEWQFVTNSGLVLPPQDQLSETLYEHLLGRVYADQVNPEVMLVLAYSSIQEGRLQVHRPEICYPAAGFSILENSPTKIAINERFAISGRFLTADRGARREYVFYWIRVGSEMPDRWVDQRWVMAKANLLGYIPDGLLARVSVISDDRDEALALLSGFVRTLLGSVAQQGRSMLIGLH